MSTHPDLSEANRESVLEAARTRQAKSRTVRAMRLAAHGNVNDGGGLAARIQCFAAEPNPEIEVRGSFWQKTAAAEVNEEPIYHSTSANNKNHNLSPSRTGPELNLKPHGAEKNHD
ncbi:hypothetical protein [Sphingorhabdus sp.]|uniref:hypothetical protein n=1 Tax=Sphingorhabdus sp. TaxID=1902408 RepID=UPI0033409E58